MANCSTHSRTSSPKSTCALCSACCSTHARSSRSLTMRLARRDSWPSLRTRGRAWAGWPSSMASRAISLRPWMLRSGPRRSCETMPEKARRPWLIASSWAVRSCTVRSRPSARRCSAASACSLRRSSLASRRASRCRISVSTKKYTSTMGSGVISRNVRTSRPTRMASNSSSGCTSSAAARANCPLQRSCHQRHSSHSEAATSTPDEASGPRKGLSPSALTSPTTQTRPSALSQAKRHPWRRAPGVR